jgi:hypothetical protein
MFSKYCKKRPATAEEKKDTKWLSPATAPGLLHPAFSPQLFHLLLLVAAEAQVIVCCLDLCPANHAKHNNPNQN